MTIIDFDRYKILKEKYLSNELQKDEFEEFANLLLRVRTESIFDYDEKLGGIYELLPPQKNELKGEL